MAGSVLSFASANGSRRIVLPGRVEVRPIATRFGASGIHAAGSAVSRKLRNCKGELQSSACSDVYHAPALNAHFRNRAVTMLRLAAARSNACLEQSLRTGVRRQWQRQRMRQPLRRTYADDKPIDRVVVPGTPTRTVAGVPTGPVEAGIKTSPTPSEIPRTPPTPAEVQSKPPTPTPSTTTGTLPPTGEGTASTSSAPPPPPKRPRHRLRNFLLSLIVLSVLGYGGAVYYALVSDNFHDFFTEYIPFGEDAVGYFEEREFRKRFPTREYSVHHFPQRRGEQKVTIGRQSGLTPQVADANAGADLGQKGRHLSAVEDNKPQPKQEPKPAATSAKPPTQEKAKEEKKTPEKAKEVEVAKAKPKTLPQEAKPAARTGSKPETKTALDSKAPATPESKPAPPPPTPQIDHINVPEASEPVVQDAIKILNNIITAVNASPEASKYASTLVTAKEELHKVINGITTIKVQSDHDTETKIKNMNAEFDEAARELVRRVEGEMKEQEMKWRDEFESEREKLSASYDQKLAAELDAAHKVAETKAENSLLQQEIDLQKRFMDEVKAQVEGEREGRLAKLDELSSSVTEIEKLTSEWNEVVDTTIQTQHLQVALEAVREKLQTALPTPFLTELVALKEISKDNETVTAAIASINPVAYQRGIPSAAHLIDRFRRVAAEVRKTSLLPEDAGVASHAASVVLSRLVFQKKSERGLPEGDDVEATLARTEVLLEEGDLDSAAREMNGLKGWAHALSRDWVSECRRVLEVRQAIDVIATESRLQSLLVD